jgi:hypothetical protein
VILSHVSDPKTICSMEAVCRDFRAVIMKNSNAIWERLHQQRWTIAPSSSSLRTKAEYGRRHQLDASAIQWIGQLQESSSSSSSSTDHLYAVMHILASGKYVLDVCWNVWRRAKTNEEGHLIIARDLVHLLHCYTTCEDLVGLLAQEERAPTGAAAAAAHPPPPTRTTANSDARLEECAILTSKFFYS